MFGFGIILMHLSDYLMRRKHNKQKAKEQQVVGGKGQCDRCGKAFGTENELWNHTKEYHH